MHFRCCDSCSRSVPVDNQRFKLIQCYPYNMMRTGAWKYLVRFSIALIPIILYLQQVRIWYSESSSLSKHIKNYFQANRGVSSEGRINQDAFDGNERTLNSCLYHWQDVVNINQSFHFVNNNMFVYSAFYDARGKENPVVRVVAVMDAKAAEDPPLCILWVDSKRCLVERSTVVRVHRACLSKLVY